MARKRNYIKTRRYKENRRSRDKDPYDTYLRWHQELRENGYYMAKPKSREKFMHDYELYRKDPEIKNKIRTLAREDIVASKTLEKKMVKQLFNAKGEGDKTFADFFNWETGHFDFEGKNKKELYWTIRRQKEAGGWTYQRGNPAPWEEEFFRERGLY